MNKIEYGNYLYELRKQNDLTQRYVAYQLDISDKAVSKWETGKSKPSLEQLKILSTLYNVPLEDLIESSEEEKKVNITKIVLTGGPCGGKSTALSRINRYFTDRGYKVLTIQETATELMSNGVSPKSCGTNYDYQMGQMKLQKIKEEIFEEAAKTMNNSKILIVCDRGVLDNKAYMKDVEFKKIMKEFNTSEVKERDSYDAVFQLVTAAKGAEEAFEKHKGDNEVREEDLKGARELDDKMIAAWTGHPHFRIIDNSTDFEKKIERMLKEIAIFLGEPEPLEIERKFLIFYPKLKELESRPNCTKVDIVQTYLKSDNGSERRIRARGIDGDYMYYLTEKRKISDIKRVEVERRLSKDEYFSLLMEADPNLRSIHKTRYCLTENNQYFEIDIYPEWDKQAIMEVELADENEAINVPNYISVIEEVTDKEEYKNASMAKEMPKQLVKRKKD